MDAKTEKTIERYEVRENIGYKDLLNQRLMQVNVSFDRDDKVSVREALHTTFDLVAPYMDRFKRCRYKKKFIELSKISDKEDFMVEAHEIYYLLLKIMRDKNMLFTEVDVTLG